MLKHVLNVTIATLALASACAMADGPPAELAQLDYFVGTWNCTGKTSANPMGPEHATTATVRAGMTVGGRWLNITYDEKKSAANKMPYHVGVYMGYDATKKQFVEDCVDVFGGYCTQSSSGWNGDTMTFEGTANGMGDPGGVRDIFTKKSADHLTHMGQMQGPDKKWVETDQESCHKVK